MTYCNPNPMQHKASVDSPEISQSLCYTMQILKESSYLSALILLIKDCKGKPSKNNHKFSLIHGLLPSQKLLLRCFLLEIVHYTYDPAIKEVRFPLYIICKKRLIKINIPASQEYDFSLSAKERI